MPAAELHSRVFNALQRATNERSIYLNHSATEEITRAIVSEVAPKLAPALLVSLTARVRTFVVDRGWFEESRSRSVGDAAALLHSEVSEMFEAWRDYHDFAPHYELKLHFPCRNCGKPRDKCAKWVESTKQYTYCCSECSHINEGSLPAKPEGIPSELADILVRLLDTADAWGIDLYAAFDEKMEYNMTRPYQHGGRTI